MASVKNQSKYLTLQFNYTWSHALDEISNGGFLNFGYDSAGNLNPSTINPFNLKQQNYGNADYDIRNSLNGDYLLNVPYFGGPHLLTDNWILGGTVFWHGGFPFSVFDGTVTGNLGPNYGGEVLAQIVDPSVPHHCGINKSSPTTFLLRQHGHREQSIFRRSRRLWRADAKPIHRTRLFQYRLHGGEGVQGSRDWNPD